MWGALGWACSPKCAPRALGLDLSVFASLCKSIGIGSEGPGLELAVTGALALVAAACDWWIQDDEASCGGRLGRQFMKRKILRRCRGFSKNPISAAARNERRAASRFMNTPFLHLFCSPGCTDSQKAKGVRAQIGASTGFATSAFCFADKRKARAWEVAKRLRLSSVAFETKETTIRCSITH